jgi:hypothetical protein
MDHCHRVQAIIGVKVVVVDDDGSQGTGQEHVSLSLIAGYKRCKSCCCLAI